MAVDLTSSPSYENITTPRHSPAKTGGPFQATHLYNDVIAFLHQNICLKRKKVKSKQYASCFTGTDAVDLVQQRLEEAWSHCTKEITREKCVKLCRLFKENNIFECVASAEDLSFEDSPSKFYSFSPGAVQSEGKIGAFGFGSSRKDLSLSVHKSYKQDSPSFKLPHSSIKSSSGPLHEILDLTGSWRHSADSIRKRLTPVRLFGRKLSLTNSPMPPFSPSGGRNSLQAADVEHIWQEEALKKLLGIINIPILDEILAYDSSVPVKPKAKKEMAFSNLAFRRQDFYSPSGGGMLGKDPLVEAAVDCLECLPKGLDIIDASLNEYSQSTQKMCLYQSIVDNYKEQTDPLWSSNFNDVQVGVYSLIMQGREEMAVHALQTSLLLLANHIKEELKRVLTFMRLVGQDPSLKLSATHSNLEQMEVHFTPGIVRNKTLAPRQAGQLVLFMVDRVEEIFCCPGDVENGVQRRLQGLSHGVSAPRIDTTYCEQVSEQEFRKQQTDTTELAIVDLINSVLDDVRVPLKEKKQRLKQLRKHHHQIFDRYFQDLL